MVNQLDQLYITILHRGLISIRNASRNGDLELCKAESEYLHEIPSLIGETNVLRHIYQATIVRPEFIQWAKKNCREDVDEFIKIWFASEWKQIDVILGIDKSKEATWQ
jgi:hypothetical protein